MGPLRSQGAHALRPGGRRHAHTRADLELVRHAAANPALGVDAIRGWVAALPVS
ncbi:hypothetical protein [Streptomyces sp. NBC_00582]|uniref:hypothetical protein n=1 Tax=Streptomyces sp. NBC_00582 TaxID=2975783 RepID=UPI002E801AC0|nr:hypothetical protein [Streptomyces sp. NBC_00582]WUB59921.1 hypothetical protein OG852_05705 [Streptomyces sp. NBC_00582]